MGSTDRGSCGSRRVLGREIGCSRSLRAAESTRVDRQKRADST